jgi:coenzyme F420-reducing hydrogenase beta subunit
MACIEVCPKNAIKVEDTLEAYNAVICEDLCINCNACTRVCQNSNTIITFRKTTAWYQGWSNDSNDRKNSSSGGAAYELAKAIINRGGTVYSCLFLNGEFVFDETNTVSGLKKFLGSKYVKSNPKYIYKSIKEKLRTGTDVLFIGLPCQVAALKCVTGEKDNLYTIDLICHGTPSPQILELFLKQYGCELKALDDIRFRVKDQFQVASTTYKAFAPESVRDPYMMAFLNGLIYTENCYSCKYARRERVADITIGDSWQSDLPVETQKKGISLILAQTQKGDALIHEANMELKPVDLEKAVAANHQLQHPSIEPEGRTEFFRLLKEGKRFNALVRKNYPKQYAKQQIKTILSKVRIIRGAMIDYRIIVQEINREGKPRNIGEQIL